MSTFMLYRENQEHGPYSLDEIRARVASGYASTSDHVRATDSAEWTTISALLNIETDIPKFAESKSNGVREFVGRMVLGCLAIAVAVYLWEYLPRPTNGRGQQADATPRQSEVTSINVTPFSQAELASFESQAEDEVLEKRTLHMYGKVLQRVDGGYLINGLILSKNVGPMGQEFDKETFDQGSQNGKDYFVACDKPTLVDEDRFDQTVYFTGTPFSYTTVLGASRTLRAFSTSKADMVRQLNSEIAARIETLKTAEIQARSERAQKDAELENELAGYLKGAEAALSAGNLDQVQRQIDAANQINFSDNHLASIQDKLSARASIQDKLDAAKEKLDAAKAAIQDKLNAAKFILVSKAFTNDVSQLDLRRANLDFDTARDLQPNDASIGTLERQLTELKNHIVQNIDAKIASGDLQGAENDYSAVADVFPDEDRLPEFKARIAKAKFGAVSQEVSGAIHTHDVDGAAAKLNEAKTLLPDDPSLIPLQKDLVNAQFDKESEALKQALAGENFPDAQKELAKIQGFNVRKEEADKLAEKLSLAIGKAIDSNLERGKGALHSNDLDTASQALERAKSLDPSNSSVLAFEQQIGDFKYAHAMATVLADVEASKLSDATDALNGVLAIRPNDAVADKVKHMVTELIPIAEANQFRPDESIGGNGQSRPNSNAIFVGHVTAWPVGPKHAPAYVTCSGGSGANRYTVSLEPDSTGSGVGWTTSDGEAPAVGSQVLVFGLVYGPSNAQSPDREMGYTFVMKPLKIFPADFISQQKASILNSLKEASATPIR